MFEQGIFQLVAANAGVQAVIGEYPCRFFPVMVPEDAAYPCASYEVISDVTEYALDGSQGLRTIRMQIDTWSGGASGANYGDAKSAQQAIRAVLELFSGLLGDGTRVAAIFVGNARDSFEQDARAFRTSTDYLIHFYPAAA